MKRTNSNDILQMKNKELQGILRLYGLKISRNKKELITRIQNYEKDPENFIDKFQKKLKEYKIEYNFKSNDKITEKEIENLTGFKKIPFTTSKSQWIKIENSRINYP